MYATLLIAHIVGAVLTGIATLFVVIVVSAARTQRYRVMAQVLAVLATFEVCSGVALAAVSPAMTARALCGNIVLYLSVVALCEAILYVCMKGGAQSYPVRTLAPVGASVALFAGTVLLGL